jgi:hypothetical protein
MALSVESAVKVVLVVLLALAGLGIWLLPGARGGTRRRIDGRLFVTTCGVGMLCSAAGLVVVFASPRHAVEWHLWEAAAMPLVLVYAYWIVVIRRAPEAEVLDEKQAVDMTTAGALAWGLSIPVMGAAFVLQEQGLFDGRLWFPCYLFATLLVYFSITLYRFERG